MQTLDPGMDVEAEGNVTRSRLAERAYRRTLSVGTAEDDVVERYAPLVVKTVQRYCTIFPPDTDLQDWINIGFIGLLQGHRSFESARGVSFAHFARTCIRNAIFDEFRRRTPVSRSQLRTRQRIEETVATLTQRWQRDPEEFEVATHLGVTLEAYHQLLEELQPITFESISEPSRLSTDDGGDLDLPDLNQVAPDELAVDHDRQAQVRQRLRTLPSDLKKVITLFYYEGLRFKDIAEILGVSAARVSQLHTQAVCLLRVHLQRVGASEIP